MRDDRHGGVRGLMGYPAAEEPDPAGAWAQAAARPPRQATLYIHIPFCRSRCSFCPFYRGSADEREWRDYVNLLEKELRQTAASFAGTVVSTAYFGGGTPGDLPPEAIRNLLRTVKECYRLANDCEITLESRIDGFDEERIAAAVENGVNRFSLGVQTFDTDLRRSLDRKSDRETVLELIGRLTGTGQAAVAADILYGLPGQTPGSLLRDLDTAVKETALSGISFYRLNLHEKLPIAEKIRQNLMPELPDDEKCFELFSLCEERLKEAGAKRLSFKHFSLHPRERDLHNELCAWKSPCIPFGIGAGGRLGLWRFKQTGDPGFYRRSIEAGRKPLASAGRFPADHAVGARIAGQLNCRMNCDLEYTAAAAPEELREKVRENLENALAGLSAKGFFHAPRFGAYRLTRQGRFRCGFAASELMECAARAWEH